MSRGGRTIMAMPRTAAKGTISKIVPLIDEVADVSTSRYHGNYVVTEYGIAQLKGETLRERARELIKIAHPDFREERTYTRRFRRKQQEYRYRLCGRADRKGLDSYHTGTG